MYVKICGLTHPDDVRAAVDAGADAIGLVLCPSPRRVADPERLLALLDGVVKVAVFRAWAGEDVAGFDVVQAFTFAGDPPLPALAALTADQELPDRLVHPRFPVRALCDAPGGGTGRPADLPAARALAQRGPIALAGGLTPENVADAIASIRPAALDVSSGVEAGPGRKDPVKMRAFVRAVHL